MRPRSHLLAFVTLAFVVLAFAVACEDTPGAACVGGIVLPDGTCAARCDPAKCLPGNVCVDNACVLTCEAHLECTAGAQSCLPAVEDETAAAVSVCLDNGAAGVGAPCPLGDECTAPLGCLGAGVGDALAYCTRFDCAADADCPGGYECGLTRDPRAICGTDKGNGGRCGTTDAACVDPSMLSPDGPLIEGPDCILRRACVQRSACAPCASALDCSLVAGLDCVDVGGSSRCAATCLGDGDCKPSETCAAGACKPRFGTCEGTGGFCEPCRDDLDCAALGPTGACMEIFRGETACIDQAMPATCTTSDDCPTSPSGRHGTCIDETLGVVAGDPLYHHCTFPYDQATNAFGCW
jgi:hypothetical protein